MSEKGEEATEETTTTMAGAEEPQIEQPQRQQQQEIKKPEKFSFSIWPPTQRTRDAVINRLVETLTAPSVLSNRYGSMPSEEASSAARLIEENAFSAASSAHTTDDDGMEILQTYSKEISRKMLEAVKSNAASASSQRKQPTLNSSAAQRHPRYTAFPSHVVEPLECPQRMWSN